MSKNAKIAAGGVAVGLLLLFWLPWWASVLIILGVPAAAYLTLDPRSGAAAPRHPQGTRPLTQPHRPGARQARPVRCGGSTGTYGHLVERFQQPRQLRAPAHRQDLPGLVVEQHERDVVGPGHQ